MFKISEIGNLPEGSVGIIKDDDGNVVHAFIRKQYHASNGPEFVLTDAEYSLSVVTDAYSDSEGGPIVSVLTSEKATRLIPDEDVDWEDEEDADEAIDRFNDVAKALPKGSIVLIGDVRTEYNTFLLGKKQDDDKWMINRCGYSDYDDARLKNERLYSPATNEERRAGDESFEGSVEVFPYTFDTSAIDD